MKEERHAEETMANTSKENGSHCKEDCNNVCEEQDQRQEERKIKLDTTTTTTTCNTSKERGRGAGSVKMNREMASDEITGTIAVAEMNE